MSTFTVHYADTDAYGVVWHGTYLRWLEAGRVEFLEQQGLDIIKLQNEDGIVLPVAALELKYITPARLGERVEVKTYVNEVKNASASFNQEIVNAKNPATVYLRAFLKCGGINSDGKLVKNMKELFKPKG
jgi:acyl-CoA thioester hydrolase